MLKFFTFPWLLKFIYQVSRMSGCIYTKIKFHSVQKVTHDKSIMNTIIYMLSVGSTLLAFSYDAHIPIAELTHSRLMEVAVNLIVRMSIWFLFVLKIANTLQSRTFFDIISNLQWCELKVFIT